MNFGQSLFMFPPNEIDGHAFNPICNALPKAVRSESVSVNTSTRSGTSENGGATVPGGANVNAMTTRLAGTNTASSSAAVTTSPGVGAREETTDNHSAAAIHANASNASIAIRRGSAHADPGSEGGRRGSRINVLRVTDDLGIGVGSGAGHAMVHLR